MGNCISIFDCFCIEPQELDNAEQITPEKTILKIGNEYYYDSCMY